MVLFPLENLLVRLVGDLEGERLGLFLREFARGSLFCRQTTLSVREARASLPSKTRLILTEGLQDRAIIETTFCTESFLRLGWVSCEALSNFLVRFYLMKGCSYSLSIYCDSAHSKSDGILIVLASSGTLSKGKREKLDYDSIVSFLPFLMGGRFSALGSRLRLKMDLLFACLICCLIC